MSLSGDSQVSAVLQAAQAGDAQAAADLLPLVYAELHQLARARLARQAPGQTLTPTALVHEAYLRIAGDSHVTWEGRQHFFFAAARAMRDILVEQARRKAGPKRGGGRRRQELDEACAVLEPPSDDVLAVHEALAELGEPAPSDAVGGSRSACGAVGGWDRTRATRHNHELTAVMSCVPFVFPGAGVAAMEDVVAVAANRGAGRARHPGSIPRRGPGRNNN